MSGGFFGGGGGSGGGITNDAPVGAIPVTVDGDGNLTDSKITSDGQANPAIGLKTNANGTVSVRVVGVGGQFQIAAADGDETHVGGEMDITTGGSIGQNGGDMIIRTGGDTDGGDSGDMTLRTGSATDGEGNGGSTGSITFSVGSGTIADFHGGGISFVAGPGVFGGGSIIFNAGPRTGDSGSHGTIQAYSADASQGVEINNSALNVLDKLAVTGNVGFYGVTPVTRPNIPLVATPQAIADALVALGLVTQS